jgi:hypothetical protein
MAAVKVRIDRTLGPNTRFVERTHCATDGIDEVRLHDFHDGGTEIAVLKACCVGRQFLSDGLLSSAGRRRLREGRRHCGTAQSG